MSTSSSKERRSPSANEHFANIHSPSDCDLSFHGRHPARRRCRLPPAAGFSAASSRLSNDSGCDLLSRSEPRSDGIVHHCTAGTTIRTGAGLESDDLFEFQRRFGHYAPVCAGSEHRCGGTGSSGRNQRWFEFPAERSAESSDLQQDQSGRCADPDSRADVADTSTLENPGSCRHSARAKDIATFRSRTRQHQRWTETGCARPGQPDGAFALRPEHGGPAHDHCVVECESGQRELRRAETGLHRIGERSASVERSIPAAHRRLSEWSASAGVGRRERRRWRRKCPAGCVDEFGARNHRQRSTPTRNQHH